MRDKKEALCRKYVEEMKEVMGFAEWTIDVRFERLEGNVLAETTPTAEYRRASIVFDLAGHSDQNESLLASVRHEFLHLIHSQLELYRQSVSVLVASSEWAILDKIWGHSCEDMVARMEKMLDNLGQTPKKILRRKQ